MRRFFFLISILFFCGSVWAQGTTVPAYREAGLPFIQNFGPKVYAGMRQNLTIVQDQRGLMYFGQTSFVLEYDGVSWRYIPTAYNISTLSLTADENGRIFLGAQGAFGYLSPDAQGQLQYVSLLDYVDPEQRDFTNVSETISTSHGIYFRTHKYLFRWQTSHTRAEDPTLEGVLHVWKPETSFERITLVRDTVYVLQPDVGLMKVVGDTLQEVMLTDPCSSLRIYPSRYHPNLAFAGSIDSMAALQRVEGQWTFVGHVANVFGGVRNIEEERPGVLWVSTRVSGNYRVTLPHLQKSEMDTTVKMGPEDLMGEVEQYEEAHGAANGTLVLTIVGRTI